MAFNSKLLGIEASLQSLSAVLYHMLFNEIERSVGFILKTL